MTDTWMIGTHKVEYDNDHNTVILYVGNENFTENDVKAFHDVYSEIYKDKDSGRNLMVILDDVGTRDAMSKESRKTMQDGFKKYKIEMDKTAIVGASPGIRMIAKIVMKMSRVKDSRFCNTKKEAYEWFSGK